MTKQQRGIAGCVVPRRAASSRSCRPLWMLGICLGVFALSGAGCPNMVRQFSNPLPRVLPASPTLEQVVEVVNRNSSQITSFSANRASLGGPGFPSLDTSVAFERSKRFRLRAGTGLTGTEVDLGSNDELFWFWVRRNQPPAMYYCRHEEFAASPVREAMPFDPTWLIEALGVAEFDPSLAHQLTTQPNDRLRVDTIRNTPQGPVTKVTILDGSQGWVLEQHLYDARRRLLVSSVASNHRRDPMSGLVMPKNISIRCPAAQLNMHIDLGNVEINRLTGDRASLWSMPNYPNASLVNLADPSQIPPSTAPMPAVTSQRPSPSAWQRPGRR